MGVKLDLTRQDGKIFSLDIGEGFLEREKFNEIVGVIKDLEDRHFDSPTKKWLAPLTEANIKTLELILSKEELKELKEFNEA